MNPSISRQRCSRVFLGSLVVSLVAGCATLVASRSAASEVARVEASGRLVVLGYPTAESRFLRWRTENGPLPVYQRADRYEGIDVEILRRFAAGLGVELWVQRVSEPDYGQLIPDLLANRGDLVAGSFSITRRRQEVADFSRPYFQTSAAVVVEDRSPIVTPGQLRGGVGAVLVGSSHEQRLLADGHRREHLREVASKGEGFEALEAGEADFMLMEDWRAAAIPHGFRVAFRLAGAERYGFCLRRGSDLLPRLDAFLHELEASGALAEIVARYLAAGSKVPARGEAVAVTRSPYR